MVEVLTVELLQMLLVVKRMVLLEPSCDNKWPPKLTETFVSNNR
jgi:hypothetical protein